MQARFQMRIYIAVNNNLTFTKRSIHTLMIDTSLNYLTIDILSDDLSRLDPFFHGFRLS